MLDGGCGRPQRRQGSWLTTAAADNKGGVADNGQQTAALNGMDDGGDQGQHPRAMSKSSGG